MPYCRWCCSIAGGFSPLSHSEAERSRNLGPACGEQGRSGGQRRQCSGDAPSRPRVCAPLHVSGCIVSHVPLSWCHVGKHRWVGCLPRMQHEAERRLSLHDPQVLGGPHNFTCRVGASHGFPLVTLTFRSFPRVPTSCVVAADCTCSTCDSIHAPKSSPAYPFTACSALSKVETQPFFAHIRFHSHSMIASTSPTPKLLPLLIRSNPRFPLLARFHRVQQDIADHWADCGCER
jgi:hypothetical protein